MSQRCSRVIRQPRHPGGATGEVTPRPARADEPSSPVTPPTEAEVATARAWGLGGRTVLLVSNLVATPFLLRLLGPSRYGMWTLLLVAITWASISDLGMGTASTKFGAEQYARGDASGESKTVWTALALIGVTTGFLAIAVAVGAHTVVLTLAHGQGRLVGDGATALRIACVVLVLQSGAVIVNTPQVVRLKWRQWTFITTSLNALGIVAAPVALACFGGGLTTVAVVMMATAFLTATGNLLLALHLQPALRRPSFDKALLRRLVAYGGALAIAGMALIPLTTAERFFLAYHHSAATVARYAVAANLATTLHVLPEQLVAPCLPGLARLRESGRMQELRSLYQRSLAGLYLLLTPAAILLCLVAGPFLSLWAGPAYGADSTGPLLVLAVGVWLNCLAYMPNVYLLSSGHTKTIARIKTAELAPFLLGAWVLVQHYGIMGAAVAWSARCALDSALLFGAARRVASLPVVPLSERRLRSVTGTVALGGAALVMAVFTNGLGARLGAAATLAVAYGLVSRYLVLTPDERHGIAGLIPAVNRTQRRREPTPAPRTTETGASRATRRGRNGGAVSATAIPVQGQRSTSLSALVRNQLPGSETEALAGSSSDA